MFRIIPVCAVIRKPAATPRTSQRLTALAPPTPSVATLATPSWALRPQRCELFSATVRRGTEIVGEGGGSQRKDAACPKFQRLQAPTALP